MQAAACAAVLNASSCSFSVPRPLHTDTKDRHTHTHTHTHTHATRKGNRRGTGESDRKKNRTKKQDKKTGQKMDETTPQAADMSYIILLCMTYHTRARTRKNEFQGKKKSQTADTVAERERKHRK
jgi:hypothetical protein